MKAPPERQSTEPEVSVAGTQPVTDSGGFPYSALDLLSEAVVIADSRSLIVYANDAMTALFGYPIDELIGQHVAVLGIARLHPETGRHLVLSKKDGTILHAEVRVEKLKVGERHHWMCVFADQKSRLLAEMAERQAAVIESSDDAIVTKNLDGIITSWNKGAQQIFGYTAEEVVGRHISVLAPPERMDEFPSILGRLRQGERIEHYETLRRTKDGRIIDVSLTVSPIRNAAGEIVGASKIARDITSRKAAEAALSKREQEVTTLLASLPDIVMRFGPDLRFRYISPAILNATGLQPAEFIGKTHAESGFTAAPFKYWESKVAEVFATGKMVTADFSVPRENGDSREYTAIAVPEFSRSGSVESVLAIVRNVTSEQRAKAAQRAIERELLLLIEASSALLAAPDSENILQKIIDLAQRFVSADAHAVWRRVSNDEWALVSSAGLSERYIQEGRLSHAERVSPEPLTFHPSGATGLMQNRRAAYESEGIVRVLAVPLMIRDEACGTVAYYWRSEHEISEPEIRIAKALANLAAAALSAAELYERELAAKQRAEGSEQRATFLAESGLLLSSSLDYETTLANVTKLAVPVFADWCAVDILTEGGDIVRVATQHSDPAKIRLAHEFRRKHQGRDDDLSNVVLRTGKAVMFEKLPDELLVKNARSAEHLADLRELNIRSFIVAPLLAGDRSVGTMTFANSESGRSYNSDDLRVAEDIGRRAGVAIAHARLFRETKRVELALRLSNQELKHLNEDLNQFAYSASHDLQEPLRMVSIYSQLLEKKYRNSLDDTARQYISFTVQGANRMEMMVRDLLAYTLAASERSGEEITLVSTEAVLHRVLLNLEASILESGAVIERTPLPPVLVSEVHLLQIFQNLIGNAIKYRHKDRPPRITVSATEAADMVTFSIADNGIGIPEDYQRQVFGLFKRLHTADQYAGTGIGLAICQRLVQRYGGQIWVESKQGQGSTFRLTLPSRADN